MDLDTRLASVRSLTEIGRWAEARAMVVPVLDADTDGEAWCLLSLCDLRLGNLQWALYAGDRAVALAPESEWGHRLRSMALTHLKFPGAAVEAAGTSVALAPLLWQTHVALAEAYLGAWGHQEQARAAALRATELGPMSAATHITLGRAEAALRNFSRAEHCYLRALEIDPDNTSARNNLGVVALARNRPGHAMKHFASSAGGSPRSSLSARNWNLAAVVLLQRLLWGVLGLGLLVAGLAEAPSTGPQAAVSSKVAATSWVAVPGRVVLCALGLAIIVAFAVRRARSFGRGNLRAFLRSGHARGPVLLLAAGVCVDVFAAFTRPSQAVGAFCLVFGLWVTNAFVARAGARAFR